MQFETYSRNPIVLFDIDGTVTEARRLVTRKMIDVLRQLSYITEIAFVTGSNLEYAKEQLWPLLANEEIRINCHILPCNGTEYYIPDPDKLGSFLTIYEASMENTIGFEKFQKLMKIGGDTSFDIYPEGWDKTFALKHFPHDLWTHYFIGDRCYPDGNDFEIFNFLNKEGRAWETSGPEETIEIIEINLMKTLEIGE